MSESSSAAAPDVANALLEALHTEQELYEEQYAESESDEERELTAALDILERYAARLITSASFSNELSRDLSSFKPNESVGSKIRDLLLYNIAQHRLEFDVARGVCKRLHTLDKRVMVTTVLAIVLDGQTPSATAVKYFERATTLYLAGYETESIIMCGAVLEAALRARITNDEMIRAGLRPAFRTANDFSVAQRLQYSEKVGALNAHQLDGAWELVNWRNDAVHVQPDIGPNAKDALRNLVVLLPQLVSGDDSTSDK
jgi:hypothetical protein